MPSVAEALEVWVSVETERFLWHCSSKPWPLPASQYLQLRRCVLFRHSIQARLKPSTHPVWLWTLAFENRVCGFVWYFFSFAVFLFLVSFVENLSETQRPITAAPFMSKPCVLWKKGSVLLVTVKTIVSSVHRDGNTEALSVFFLRSNRVNGLCTRFPYQSLWMQMVLMNAISFWGVRKHTQGGQRKRHADWT